MSPERTDEIGIVHFWDDKLGVPDNEHWAGCHFVDPENYQRVQMKSEQRWDNGKTGTWVGWQDRIDNSYGIPFPRLESVVWDGEKAVSGIHRRWLLFRG